MIGLILLALVFDLVLRHTTETVTGTFTFRNHWAVANTIGARTATTGGAGHPGMTKWIVIFFRISFFNIFSHCYRLEFSNLATFQVIGTN